MDLFLIALTSCWLSLGGEGMWPKGRVDGCGVGRRGSVGLGVTVDGSISGAEGEAGWSGNIGKI